MVQFKAKHKSKSGGLSEAGRKYAKSQGMNLKDQLQVKLNQAVKQLKDEQVFVQGWVA